MATSPLLSAATATGAGSALSLNSSEFTAQATGTVSTSTGAATIAIEVSNDQVKWLTLGTITLTLGTAAVSDGFAAFARWQYVRANVTAISGTDATVTVTLAA